MASFRRKTSFFGTKKSDLRRYAQNAYPKLRELENSELIHREVYPVIPPKVEYSLTEIGRNLMPVLIEMRDWGAAYLRTKDLEPNCFMMKKITAKSTR